MNRPTSPRTAVMIFRLTEDEATVIKAAADFYGISVSALIRGAVLARASGPLVTITVNGVRVTS